MSTPYQTPPSIRLIQALAVTGTGIVAGSNLLSTIAAVPSLLHSPAPLLAKQWKSLFDNGLLLVAPCGVAAATGFAYLAYHSASTATLPPGASVWGVRGVKLYTAAAVAALAFAPYTQVFMAGVNGSLKAAAGRAAQGAVGKDLVAAGEGSVHDLVSTWSKFNLVRGFLSVGAVMVGVFAVGEAGI